MANSESDHNVVVTGMGAVTPIGIGLQEYWASLIGGQSGVKTREHYDDNESPLRFYAPVIGFDGRQWIKPRKAMKVMCEPIQFGYAAATMAVEQAGLGEDDRVDRERVGTVFGSETFFSHPANVSDVFHQCREDGKYQHDRWGSAAMREIEPLWMLKYLPNMVTSHVSIAADARGPSNTICQREVSGLLALSEGVSLIRRGICDAVIVGGTGSCISLTVSLYHGMQLLSSSSREPSQVCRPFELNRDGTVYGEGAGAIVLESERHANKRDAEILCRIAGTSRNYFPADKHGFSDAISNNLAATLQQAKLGSEDLSHINAHGWGSPQFDELEADAIERVLPGLPALGLKSYFGFLGAGSSTIELIASILSLKHKMIPGTLNYDDADPKCPCNIRRENEEASKNAAIKLAFSVHGQITSVAIHA